MSEPHSKPRNGQCSHRRYQLLCDDYEDLRAWAGDCCQICGTPAAPDRPVSMSLFVDHDWSKGWWAVRGLLCRACNRRPAVDGWQTTGDARIQRYLATPWWEEMARRKGWQHIGDEPLDRSVRVAPHGWVFARTASGRWGNTTASYRKGALTWAEFIRTYGPYAASIV